MFTRSAIFSGRIHAGMEEVFYAAVAERLIPAWGQMLHAQAVRVFRPRRAEAPAEGVFLVQEIDYPSLAAIDEALAAPNRQAATEALASIQHMYEGAHHDVVYERLMPLSGR